VKLAPQISRNAPFLHFSCLCVAKQTKTFQFPKWYSYQLCSTLPQIPSHVDVAISESLCQKYTRRLFSHRTVKFWLRSSVAKISAFAGAVRASRKPTHSHLRNSVISTTLLRIRFRSASFSSSGVITWASTFLAWAEALRKFLWEKREKVKSTWSGEVFEHTGIVCNWLGSEQVTSFTQSTAFYST